MVVTVTFRNLLTSPKYGGCGPHRDVVKAILVAYSAWFPKSVVSTVCETVVRCFFLPVENGKLKELKSATFCERERARLTLSVSTHSPT